MADVSRLPGAAQEHWVWQHRGRCRTLGVSLFFGADGERGSRREEREQEAKRICAGCPVLEPCRSHALRVREPYGIWGGLTEHEREQLYRRWAS
jgi:WhiB family transcriptional regulator, redox-sensing transcriptional regulator